MVTFNDVPMYCYNKLAELVKLVLLRAVDHHREQPTVPQAPDTVPLRLVPLDVVRSAGAEYWLRPIFKSHLEQSKSSASHRSIHDISRLGKVKPVVGDIQLT